MLKKIFSSFLLAFHNIRSHFFHTLLSVLGIVIGVAALVSILSLIDGLEDHAKKQIANTTNLKAVQVAPNLFKNTNGVRLRKDTFSIVTYDDYHELKNKLTKQCSINFMASFSGTVTANGKQLGVVFYAVGSPSVRNGVSFTKEQIESSNADAVTNLAFIKVMDSTLTPEQATGKIIAVKNKTMTIRSVFDDKAKDPRIAFSMKLLTTAELRENPPSLTIEADVVEDVTALKSEVQQWINKKYKDPSDFNVFTNEMRVEQATQAFLLFRVVMGLIVGISVVVGGIGIMNVLLISITERTVEIGIRKAVGANRRDIILQFLAESVTVSVFGSVIGLVVGVLGTMVVVPIVASVTKIPFYANYTMNTLIVVSVMAVLLGIVFGTYPAIRASKLDPVEAIRHE